MGIPRPKAFPLVVLSRIHYHYCRGNNDSQTSSKITKLLALLDLSEASVLTSRPTELLATFFGCIVGLAIGLIQVKLFVYQDKLRKNRLDI